MDYRKRDVYFCSKVVADAFYPWTKQVNAQLNVSVDGVQIPTVKNPKLLGVTLDPLFTFSAQSSVIARKASSRLNLMRALSDSLFGKDKECLLSTYKLFIRSLIDYAAPIIYPNYAESSIERLQKIQSCALRLALSCHSTTSIDHLYAKAQMLRVSEHHFLSSQFLAHCLQHPSHDVVTRAPGRQQMKETLRSKAIQDVQPFLDKNGVVAPGTYSNVIKSLHMGGGSKNRSTTGF